MVRKWEDGLGPPAGEAGKAMAVLEMTKHSITIEEIILRNGLNFCDCQVIMLKNFHFSADSV